MRSKKNDLRPVCSMNIAYNSNTCKFFTVCQFNSLQEVVFRLILETESLSIACRTDVVGSGSSQDVPGHGSCSKLCPDAGLANVPNCRKPVLDVLHRLCSWQPWLYEGCENGAPVASLQQVLLLDGFPRLPNDAKCIVCQVLNDAYAKKLKSGDTMDHLILCCDCISSFALMVQPLNNFSSTSNN